ncbi:hypothetical protein DYQ86_16195 [Acidobacteria bacterium AB60]|nr:hypothetical protein DYQ86_16195 [Acidobacteria bacterium AB60]
MLFQLQFPDGTHCKRITASEAEEMERKGDIERVSKRKDPAVKYRMISRPDPSLSKASPPMLKKADLEALVGLSKTNETRLERLIGHGLLPMTAWVTEYGQIRIPATA